MSTAIKPQQIVTSFGVSDSSLATFRDAKAALAARLLPQKRRGAGSGAAQRAMTPIPSPRPEHNLTGLGIGEKVSRGIHTGILAVKLLVRAKYASEQLPEADRLPEEIDGIPVDVEEVGTFRRLKVSQPNPRVRMRPARPGCSIGYEDPDQQVIMAGTYGALVERGGTRFLLSNNHVLADENRLPVGSPIYQPGLLDHGRVPEDAIAKLSQFIALQAAGSNTVDCAIAELDDPNIANNDTLLIGPPKGAAPAARDMEVHKFGRTSGYRAGRITSIDTDVVVEYDLGQLTFTGQILIVGHNAQPFSAAGDSGSLILERSTNKAVGLLFAGSASHTMANHIDQVLTALDVSLVI
jgi:hypothetical protein